MPPLLLSALIVAGALLLSLLARHNVRTFQAERYGWQRRLRHWLGLGSGQRMGELWFAGLVLHVLVWAAAGYLVLRAWDLVELADSLSERAAHAGISVYGLNIVPLRVLTGILSFIALVTFSRWINGKVAHDWLARARIEPSTRESVGTLLGYATFVVALLLGVHAAGVDLSRLAIVAGALSVGLGFGLQNIVSNFVSGVILLFEQPIRTGDYISVNETAGFVRKIRIRATEIETWDRESIIVPNSLLLSNPVKNLNLRDDYGRILVKVGVSYGSDIELVKRLLIETANRHPMVVKEGEHLTIDGPKVMFIDFGESALMFQLRVFISPITSSQFVSSDLRFAIEKSFRENRVVMPFAQHDVYLHSGKLHPVPDAAVGPGPGLSG